MWGNSLQNEKCRRSQVFPQIKNNNKNQLRLDSALSVNGLFGQVLSIL